MTHLDPTTAFHGEGSHLAEILWSFIAFLGGVAKYLHDTMKNKSPFSLFHMLAKAFVSAFSGWTMAHVALSMDLSTDWIFVFTGMGGWLGADGLEILVSYLKKKFFPPTA